MGEIPFASHPTPEKVLLGFWDEHMHRWLLNDRQRTNEQLVAFLHWRDLQGHPNDKHFLLSAPHLSHKLWWMIRLPVAAFCFALTPSSVAWDPQLKLNLRRMLTTF